MTAEVPGLLARSGLELGLKLLEPFERRGIQVAEGVPTPGLAREARLR
jgi:hypothetical protein